MGVIRKLGKVLRELGPLKEQVKTKGFFNNITNADKLCGLVEDIHCTVVDYQVCKHNKIISHRPDFCARQHYRRASMIAIVS